MKQLGFVVLGAFLCLVVTKLAPSAGKEAPLSAEVADPKTWAARGIEDIQKASPADQLRLAEEYYGKAVVLFLASLTHGLKQPAASAPNVEKNHLIAGQSNQDVAGTVESVGVVRSVSPSQEIKVSPYEIKPQEAHFERLLTYRKSQLLNKLTPEFQAINGRYEGQLVYVTEAKEGRVDKILMDLSSFMDGAKLKGQVDIQIMNPQGEVYSHSRGDGENNNFRVHPQGAKRIYLEPRPGDFIDLDINNPSRLIGPFYDADGKLVGHVELWRKN